MKAESDNPCTQACGGKGSNKAARNGKIARLCHVGFKMKIWLPRDMGWEQTETSPPSVAARKHLGTAVLHHDSADWYLVCGKGDAEPQAGGCWEEAEGRGE